MTKFWNDDVRSVLRVQPTTDLREIDPAATYGTDADRAACKAELANHAQTLRELQEKLFAQSRVGARERLLVIVQAMDAAGKGGIVNHVFGNVEPHGLAVTAFKAPTDEERAHDFLWRIEPHVPGPGVIGLFDRSHYEDVLVQRVRNLAAPEEIERRYGAILDFEQQLADDGVHIVKVMLHVSPEKQAERLLERIEEPEKHWKHSRGDLEERRLWPDYMEAFQIALTRTDRDHAPWYVVPADSKWYARAAVQRIVIETLREISPEWPEADFDIAEERAFLEESLDLRWP